MSKILIVDEEKWFLEGVTDRIDFDFGVERYCFAYNGFEALDFLSNQPFKLIILDMMMPLGGDLELPKNEPNLMYGIFILRLIRERFPKITIVCYTILDDNLIKKQIKELSAFHICKINDNAYEELFKYIKNALKNE